MILLERLYFVLGIAEHIVGMGENTNYHIVFKRLFSEAHENSGLFGKGLIQYR